MNSAHEKSIIDSIHSLGSSNVPNESDEEIHIDGNEFELNEKVDFIVRENSKANFNLIVNKFNLARNTFTSLQYLAQFSSKHVKGVKKYP